MGAAGAIALTLVNITDDRRPPRSIAGPDFDGMPEVDGGQGSADPPSA
jgi:hypothetical protein